MCKGAEPLFIHVLEMAALKFGNISFHAIREVRSSISGSSRFAFEQQNLRKLHNFCLNLTEGSEFGSVFWDVRFLNMIQVEGS